MKNFNKTNSKREVDVVVVGCFFEAIIYKGCIGHTAIVAAAKPALAVMISDVGIA